MTELTFKEFVLIGIGTAIIIFLEIVTVNIIQPFFIGFNNTLSAQDMVLLENTNALLIFMIVMTLMGGVASIMFRMAGFE